MEYQRVNTRKSRATSTNQTYHQLMLHISTINSKNFEPLARINPISSSKLKWPNLTNVYNTSLHLLTTDNSPWILITSPSQIQPLDMERWSERSVIDYGRRAVLHESRTALRTIWNRARSFPPSSLLLVFNERPKGSFAIGIDVSDRIRYTRCPFRHRTSVRY